MLGFTERFVIASMYISSVLCHLFKNRKFLSFEENSSEKVAYLLCFRKFDKKTDKSCHICEINMN